MNLREFVEGTPSLPYFVECLKRKSIISTETCMHIHNHILMFRQYLKTVQLMKGRNPDPRIPA